MSGVWEVVDGGAAYVDGGVVWRFGLEGLGLLFEGVVQMEVGGHCGVFHSTWGR